MDSAIFNNFLREDIIWRSILGNAAMDHYKRNHEYIFIMYPMGHFTEHNGKRYYPKNNGVLITDKDQTYKRFINNSWFE